MRFFKKDTQLTISCKNEAELKDVYTKVIQSLPKSLTVSGIESSEDQSKFVLKYNRESFIYEKSFLPKLLNTFQDQSLQVVVEFSNLHKNAGY